MITEKEIREAFEKLLRLDEIDRTSYQAGINHEANLDLVAHELYTKLNQPEKVNDCKPSALCVGCIDFTCDKIYQSAPDIREEIAKVIMSNAGSCYALNDADSILSIIQKTYVQLDVNQTLPTIPTCAPRGMETATKVWINGYRLGQHDMNVAGFRKVKK